MNAPRPGQLAILIGRFPPGPQGGAEHQAEAWARHLAEGHRVTVITRAEIVAPAGRTARDGYDVIRLPVSRVPLWRTLRDLQSIERTVRLMQPRPKVLLCFQTLVSGLAGVRAGRALGIPVVVWVRGEGEYAMHRSAPARWLAPRVWEGADVVLLQSEGHRLALLAALARFAPARRARIEAKLAVVPNGLDLPEVAPVLTPGGTVLSVGRLIPDKGMDTLIEAAAGLGRPVTIAGSGPERARLENLAITRGVNVRFAGFIPGEEVGRRYAQSAGVVLASRTGEGLPNVLLEAMAHARPIVATRVPGNSELIEDGVSGLLVPPGDPPALRQAIDRVLADPALAARLAAGARAAAAGYEWGQVRPRLDQVLSRWMR